MSSPLNLSTYGRDLDDAYKKVLDPKSSIDWVLTGYIGRDTLKVNKMGCGLKDIRMNLNSWRQRADEFVFGFWFRLLSPGTYPDLCLRVPCLASRLWFPAGLDDLVDEFSTFISTSSTIPTASLTRFPLS